MVLVFFNSTLTFVNSIFLNEIKDLKLQLHNITNSKNNDNIFEDKQSILDENNNNNDTTFEDKQNIIDERNSS